MKLIEVTIADCGEHWRKMVRIFGLIVYYRHDYTKDNTPKTIGFNSAAPVPGEVDADDYWPDETE